MLRIDEGLLDKNWRPSQKTVVETKVSLREKVAELNRKVGKLETCIANNEEQQTTNFNGVLRPPQEPTRRLCGYDAVVLVVHPENPKLRMNQFYVAHFQDHLRLPSLSPITVPFDEKLDVAMFVFSSLFDGFYAPFFGCTFGLHSFPLQHIMSYNNRIKYTMPRGPHYEHSQNTQF